jgi:beta-galactosidase
MRIRLLTLLMMAVSIGEAQPPGDSFAVGRENFLLNEKPFRIFSGEMHYPRIPREYWKDRLLKARAMGLNTVCTYLFWNWHEQEPGQFSFDGNLDVAGFIRTAQEVGLKVIIRPGPYVCSEWDFGGLPAWLLRQPDVRVRCLDEHYMMAVRRYVERIGKELAGLQCTRGGPIILLQVENEYGSYGNDKGYMETLSGLYRKAGFDIPFYTSDGGADYLLEAGNVAAALPVVNFGGDPEHEFGALAKFRQSIPQMCGEYWCGWFTHWGDQTWGSSDTRENLKDLEWMLSTGKSFNLYMFHGGTNFGWSAGANWDGGYKADITSYDYDAPLDEAGRTREKYRAFQSLLKKYLPAGNDQPDPPSTTTFISVDSILLNRAAPLFDNLPKPIHDAGIRSMESYNQNYGFILYRTTLRGPKNGKLTIEGLHDVGYVFLDGTLIGRLERRLNQNTIELPKSTGTHPVLDILVEGMGRINFGSRLIDRKGITDWVTLQGVTLMNWEVYPLPCEKPYLQSLKYLPADTARHPSFFKGSFSLDEVGDTFLDMSRWKKGVVWINGQNLGRYWSIGPQQRLYIPGPWLRHGNNELIVFDPEMRSPGSLRTYPTMR